MKLASTTWGRGQPLALLHGFTGTAGSFDHLRGVLQERFRVTVPDLPGHGGSPPATGWVEAIDALGAALGAGRFDLAGYSMGARLALAFALRFPERVRSLALESGSPGLADPAERARRRSEDRVWEELLLREGREGFVARWESHPTLSGLRDLPEPAAAALRKRRLESMPASLASALRHLGSSAQPPLWDELPGLQHPVLLLAGERDAKFSAIALRMAELLPRARVVLVPGSGHSPHLETPARFAAELIRFFTEAEGARP